MTLEQIKQKFKANYNDLKYLEGLILIMLKLWNTQKDKSAYNVLSDIDDRIEYLKGKE